MITEDAVTSEGLFDTHMIDRDLFYEIPLDLLGREMVLLTRIARTPDGAGYGGSKANTSTVRWERDGDRVLLRLVSYQNFADDTTAISRAVRNSNFEPIIMAFDIEVMNDDSTAAVVEVTDLFTEDITLLGLQKGRRDQYSVRRVDADRTFVVRAAAYPTNVEVRRVLTYDATDAPSNGQSNTLSMEMHHSMLLLPDNPMEPRLCDERVGFFSTSQIDYGLDEQRAETQVLRHPLAVGALGPRGLRARRTGRSGQADRLPHRPGHAAQVGALPEAGCGGLAGCVRAGRVQQRDRSARCTHRRSQLERGGRALFGDPLPGVAGAERVGAACARPAHRRDPGERHPVVSTT